MEPQLMLQSCRLSPELLQAPLPFDLYTGNGTLLSRQGAHLKGDVGILVTQPLFRVRTESECDEERALTRLESLILRYGRITEHWACSAEDVCQLKLLADELNELCGTHSDVCVCMAAYLQGVSHAVRHSFAVAIVATVLGNALGWNASQLLALTCAALTLNLSHLTSHDEWAGIRGSLSVFQQTNVRSHPSLSAEMLSRSPGADLRWITAVDQHHENLDGSGYPFGLSGDEITQEARILRVSDTWCALVMHRLGRGKKPPQHAWNELADFAGGHLDRPMFLTLKKLMGLYPPGTFVRLANRETSLVVRWDRNGPLPRHVLSVISRTGETMRQFNNRNVSQFGFGIRDYTQLNFSQMGRMPWQRIWASA